ncbi:MAG: Npt1/Npt2 family nucleotide transporter [Myxococcota bacterium]
MEWLRTLSKIRSGERRDVGFAFAMLLAFVASYQLLETARDALFLASIPATRLPWVYLGIAVVALGVTQFQLRYARGVRPRVVLAAWMGLAATVTFGFWWWHEALGTGGLYAVAIWSGVVTSLVLVHLWTLLGDLFTISQAKRLYGLIGAGSVVGAILGSALATWLATRWPAQLLLLAAAVGFALTSLLPMGFRDPGPVQNDDTDKAAGDGPSLGAAARLVADDPYARRLLVLLFSVSGTLTLVDFLFKSIVAAEVPAAELGAFFASVALALNVLSLFSQLVLVGFLLRRFDVHAALSVLPALMALGGAGVLVVGGLPAALLLKGADGSLRYSLQRTATELLFVPLRAEVRGRIKAFVDVVGQRGGQALASLLILALAAVGAPLTVAAVLLVVASGLWLSAVFELRVHYLNIFRRRLRAGEVSVSDFPELDVASLETLFVALGSENPKEAVAALEVLASEGRAHLVPTFILYHPAPPVVERALTLFSEQGRASAVPAIDRLFSHPEARLRAAAVGARAALAPDAALLIDLFDSDTSPEVRAAVAVNLLVEGAMSEEEARGNVEAILEMGPDSARVALAEAIGRRAAEGFDSVLKRLADAAATEVRAAAIRAMGAVGSEMFLPTIIAALGSESTRPVAREVLARMGPAAFRALEQALNDRELPELVRWTLPATLAGLNPGRAAALLLEQLPEESSGMVRYRIILALEAMTLRDTSLRLDRGRLDQAISAHVGRAYRYLDRRLSLERGAAQNPALRTPGHLLLVRMLADKQHNAVERLFRLLELRHRRERFLPIWRGLQSGSPEVRAASLELLESALSGELRGPVVALVDDSPDRERLENAAGFRQVSRQDYEDVLAELLDSSSDTVRVVTAHHVGELRLRRFRARLMELRERGTDRVDLELALERLTEGVQGQEVADAG